MGRHPLFCFVRPLSRRVERLPAVPSGRTKRLIADTASGHARGF